MPIVRAGDVKINYRVDGAREPLVMIMGFASPMEGWHYQIGFFSKHFHVVTFDNREAGGSDKPEGPYTTRMMADDTAHLMDKLGIGKAHIMGASMGGMIAQELAINYPERVNRLVLACTYARPSGMGGHTPERAKLSTLPPEKRAAAMINLAFNKPLNRFLFGSLGRLRSASPGSPAARGIAGQAAAIASHYALDRLASIKAETLVIVGMGDRLIEPVSSEVIASRIPGAKLVRIEGGSHTFMVENSDEFNSEVLNFLTG